MDKIKLNYKVGDQEFKLLDPEHYEEWLSRQKISGNFEETFKAYVSDHRDRLEESTCST